MSGFPEGWTLQDVTGMPEHAPPILNESGNQIMNGHLSGGMRVTVPDAISGRMIPATVEDDIFGGRAWAVSGDVAFSLVLDPVRAIWVCGCMSHSVSAFSKAVF